MKEFLTHEHLYRIGATVQERQNKKIIILGVGALGSRLADVLARQGYESMSVVDFDKVEHKNLGPQNYGKQDIGRSKAQQCAQNIMRQLGVKVEPIHKKITAENAKSILKGYDLVIDVMDNPESRSVAKNATVALNIDCIHAGMSSVGSFAIEWNENYTIPEAGNDADAPCDYPLATNLVILCVGMLAEVVNKYFEDVKEEIEFWLEKRKVNSKIL